MAKDKIYPTTDVTVRSQAGHEKRAARPEAGHELPWVELKGPRSWIDFLAYTIASRDRTWHLVGVAAVGTIAICLLVATFGLVAHLTGVGFQLSPETVGMLLRGAGTIAGTAAVGAGVGAGGVRWAKRRANARRQFEVTIDVPSTPSSDSSSDER
jgi:hypothetical protein